MAIDKIYILPATILKDVDKLIKNEIVSVNTVYEMIKSRYKGKLKFTKKELQMYIEQRRKELNAQTIDEADIVPLPVKPAIDLNISNDKIVELDKSETVNVRNRAEVLEYFKNKILKRIKLIEKCQADNIDFYLETLLINWTKEMHTIIEKEIKLQLEIEESSKLEKMIDDRLSLIFLLIKEVLKTNLSEELYNKILNQIKDIFENYHIEGSF